MHGDTKGGHCELLARVAISHTFVMLTHLTFTLRVCRGYVRHPDGTVQRQYAPGESEVPLQVQCSMKST